MSTSQTLYHCPSCQMYAAEDTAVRMTNCYGDLWYRCGKCGKQLGLPVAFHTDRKLEEVVAAADAVKAAAGTRRQLEDLRLDFGDLFERCCVRGEATALGIAADVLLSSRPDADLADCGREFDEGARLPRLLSGCVDRLAACEELTPEDAFQIFVATRGLASSTTDQNMRRVAKRALRAGWRGLLEGPALDALVAAGAADVVKDLLALLLE
eukprot:tig00001437_g8739.t1